MLDVVERLPTKAPGPHLARPYCCYIKTIIFYVWPHRVNPFARWWKDRSGKWREGDVGSFYEWDRLESSLAWDTVFEFDGKKYVASGPNRVFWKHGAWWMQHSAREFQSS